VASSDAVQTERVQPPPLEKKEQNMEMEQENQGVKEIQTWE
jgi:hypothetical protein